MKYAITMNQFHNEIFFNKHVRRSSNEYTRPNIIKKINLHFIIYHGLQQYA